jgi:hypothetical protein
MKIFKKLSGTTSPHPPLAGPDKSPSNILTKEALRDDCATKCVHIVAETDHYQLLDLDNDDSSLGFRGERLARNHDARLLHENNPEVFGWVVSTPNPLGKVRCCAG